MDDQRVAGTEMFPHLGFGNALVPVYPAAQHLQYRNISDFLPHLQIVILNAVKILFYLAPRPLSAAGGCRGGVRLCDYLRILIKNLIPINRDAASLLFNF
jgi:hypothetical protein